jgi:hypothetical protein
MGNESKIIRKTDDSAMALLHEILGDKANEIADIDSYYKIDGHYVFLEFIKCNKRPFDYEPNENWNEINHQISVIWDFVNKAEGTLWIICHEANKEQFRLLKIKSVSKESIDYYELIDMSFDDFKIWFQKLNSDVLNK